MNQVDSIVSCSELIERQSFGLLVWWYLSTCSLSRWRSSRWRATLILSRQLSHFYYSWPLLVQQWVITGSSPDTNVWVLLGSFSSFPSVYYRSLVVSVFSLLVVWLCCRGATLSRKVLLQTITLLRCSRRWDFQGRVYFLDWYRNCITLCYYQIDGSLGK